MWVMSTIGFFSFVCEHADPSNPGAGSVKDVIIVRARLRAHLEALKVTMKEFAKIGRARETALLHASQVAGSKIIEGGGTDYPFRIKISKDASVTTLAVLGEQIDYDNFKGAVQDPAYHDALMGVWSCMRRLESCVSSKVRRSHQ